MERNDYRRALIMLRSLLNGYSGHARIEIRTLMGSLCIHAGIPGNAQSVRAALVGRNTYEYYAYPLGNLRRDMRGQAGLTVSFDPRDIGGRMLDAYSLLALVTINDGVCRLALVGNLNGSRQMDWSRVRDAVCALYAPQPRSVLPEPQDEEPEEIVVPAPAAEPLYQDDSADETSDEGLVWDLTPDEPQTAAAEEIPEDYRRDGWAYARVELPGGCGFTHAYVGSPGDGGEICCALPAAYSPEPPAGLDGYEWSGGTGRGWWVRCFEKQS